MEVENTFNILIASDIHLGYAEKDPIRGEDSFNTFEEILKIAVKKEVDFLLLGGDLFHDNKPSPQCIHKCIYLLRQYCMGSRPVKVEFLSDQSENFQHCRIPVVNYDDPNLNISIPVYSIHGNHDDPSGYGRIASLDLISASGLVNYFGKWTDLTQVQISPLLMQKGTSKLALYGLSHIKDERLARLYRDRKVVMLKPKEFTDEWFNIFVLHQNRVMRGPNNYIPEEALDEFLDLVVWGHEHECQVTPEQHSKGFHVIQPGSPVATSLCAGEAVEKFVSLVQVKGKGFQVHPIKLKTVRPFTIETLNMSNCTLNTTAGVGDEQVRLYLTERIEGLIRRSEDQLTGDRRQPTVPLIRLRVEYSKEMEFFNPIRFGQQFADRVANPTDMILLKRERRERRAPEENPLDHDAMGNVLHQERGDVGDDWGNRAESVVERYFAEHTTKQLNVLSVSGLAEAVKHFIEKSDNDAISLIINHQIQKTIKHIKEMKLAADEETIMGEIENFRILRQERAQEEIREAEQTLENREDPVKNGNANDEVVTMDLDSEGEMNSTVAAASSGRGRGRGARARGRGEASTSPAPSRGRGSRGPRSRGTTAAAANTRNIKEALSVTRTSSRAKAKPSKFEFVSDSDSD